jgi:tight adherence protein B
MLDLSPDTIQLVLGLIIALSAAAVIFAIVNPLLSGGVQVEKRLNVVKENKSTRTARRVKDEEVSSRRKQVADTLRDLEERQRIKEKVSLRIKLDRAGIDMTPKTFWIISATGGFVLAAFVFFSMPGAPIAVPIAALFVGVLGLPQWLLKQMIKRRYSKFINEFANAIDVIVRGVKSGLPLNECLGIIARESPAPIKEEFQDLVDQQRMGVPLSECFERMMMRVPLPEVKFFAIVVAIQQQAGGNLSEALGNLSGVLRDRKRLQAKVKALSAEAKASAAVLGSLPFIVMFLVYITTPDYIGLLFKTKMGNFLLLIAGCWMSCGMLVMRKMINFKY